MAAPAFRTARSRAGPGSPAKMRRAVSALTSGVPPATSSYSAGGRPTESGVSSYVRTAPSSTSTTRVEPDVLSSSSPSALDTTIALRAPRRARARAITSRKAGSDTPMTCRVAPAGLVSGPRKLKMVRTASSLRTGTTCRVAPWCAGANMKPNPASRMHSATAAGGRSMRTPSASSTSAEPDKPVAERLPCLATAQPAPAAISAAVVETLNVGRPPPVPAVSIRSPRSASTGVAIRRMVVASPTISSTVSPFVRSAMRTAAVSVSDALPAMISPSTAAASSTCRSSREARRPIALVSSGFGIQEVRQQALALGRQHRLRVELHAVRGQLPMLDRHHDAAAARGHAKARGQVRVHDEGVIPTDGQRRRQACEEAFAVVLDLRRLAVHGHVADHRAAEGLRERLMAEAHAERRHAGLGEAAHGLDGHAGLVRRARPGRDDHAVGPPGEQRVDVLHVVADDLELGAQLAQVLHEVVGEGVVVVDDRHADAPAHGHASCRVASSIARATARALLRDSSYS